MFITVALIAENPVLRIGLKSILKDIFTEAVIQESQNIHSLDLNAFSKEPPDLALICTGPAAQAKEDVDQIKKVKQLFSACSVVVYDTQPDQSQLADYLKAGAAGYISKNTDPKEITDCVVSVLDGRRYITREGIDWILNEYIREEAHSQTPLTQKKTSLTPNENSIATLLAAGMRVTDIATKMERKISTISTVKNRIYKKLKIQNVIELRDIMGD